MESRGIYISLKEKTFNQDDKLPSLPVPDLEKTLNKYLQSVEPFLNTSERQKTQNTVENFKHGVGRDLQSMLLEKASKEKNWVKIWWENYAYLSLREPLLPYYSMGGSLGLESVPWPRGSTRMQQTSLYTYFLVEFWKLLKEEHVIPTKNAEGKYLNMMQFKNLYNTSRQVGFERDEIKCHFKTGADCPSHVVVMCKGRFFLLDVMSGHAGMLTPAEWEEQLNRVLAACEEVGPGLAVLTCDNRTTWAKNRQWLSSISSYNQEMLRLIDSAVFVLVLDDHRPGSEAEGLRIALSGNLVNRWADKSLSLICFNDGSVGAVSDHAAYDGMVSIAAFHYVLLGLQECQGEWLGSRHLLPSLPVPIELKFELDSLLNAEIQRLKVETASSTSLLSIVRAPFLDYGKSFIQSFKLSSDAYIQLALQLAYYKLHGRAAPMYETATTRQFYSGRTETVRSCTAEAVTWIQEMLTVPRDNMMCIKLLREAIKKHNDLMREAREGQGCDRHLFGLQCLAMEAGIPLPDIYKDPAWTRSGGGGNFILSTSLVGYTPSGGAVAPMCLHGYGCFYSILDHRIYFSISAWKNSTETSSHKLFAALIDALINMNKILNCIPKM